MSLKTAAKTKKHLHQSAEIRIKGFNSSCQIQQF